MESSVDGIRSVDGIIKVNCICILYLYLGTVKKFSHTILTWLQTPSLFMEFKIKKKI